MPFAGRWSGPRGELSLLALARRFAPRFPQDAVRYWQAEIAALEPLATEAAATPALAEALTADLAQAHLDLARHLYPLGDVRRACDHCRRAVELRPSRAVAQQQLADFLRDQRQYTAAANHYQAALKANPQLVQARLDLLTVRGRIVELERRVADLTAALRADADDAATRLERVSG